MNRILPILRKDLRHLWPQALVLWPLMYIAVYDPNQRGWNLASMLLEFLPVAATLACWNLIIALVHQESLVGDRQYWLTRPFAWRDLLAAKALAIALLVNLPLFLFQTAVFLQNGVSPIAFFSALLWKQAFFSVYFILPGIALACLTRSLPQAALAALAMLGVGAILLTSISYTPFSPYFGYDWIQAALAGMILLAGAALLVCIQYSQRRHVLARLLFAAVLAIALFGARFFPISLALAIQNRTSPQPLHDSQLAIALAPGPKCPFFMRGERTNSVALEIPIRIDALPDDSILLTSNVRFRIRRSGRTLDIAPSPFNRAHDVFAGRGWLRLFVPAAQYQTIAAETVEIKGSLEFDWFAHTATVPPRNLDDAWPGACRVTGPDQHHGIVCATPQPHGSITLIQQRDWLGYRPTSTGMEPYQTSSTYQDVLVPEYATLAPFPYDPSFAALQKYSRESASTVTTMAALIREPAAYVERRFDFKNVKLADFVP